MAEELAAGRRSAYERLSTLAGRRPSGAWPTAVASVLAIAAISGTEFLQPRLTSLGSLILLAVLAAGWLLEGPPLLAVVLVALGSRVAASLTGGLDLGTVVAESVAIVLIAVTGRTASTAQVRALQAERRAAEQQAEMARLDERERIATEMRTTALAKLFGVTLSIEAALESSPEESERRLRAAISELDQLSAEMRSAIFRPGAE